MFYELFQLKVDDGGLSLSEQEILFDSLEAKQKCALYNSISLQAREDYCKYIELIPDAEGTKLDKFLTTIRGQAVADALVIEQNLLDGGMCTRDWSIEQIKEIYRFGKRGGLSSVAGTPHEFDYFGNPEYHITLTKTGEIKVSTNAMEGHHMLNVHDYPQFAGDGKNIQFLGKLAAHAKEVFIPRTHYA
ncbi:MAG: hypothetical protein IJ265_11985 [Oscillospiraceae bacterium]|nr:hypothetical protein [Oscillospiraceae bacterium]